MKLHPALTLALAAFLPGCAISVDLPNEFLPTYESRTEFRATTADNTLFFVEKLSLGSEGDNLQFWVDAVKHEFVENRGYVFVSDDEKTVRGKQARRLVFEATVQGRPYRYMFTLFIERGWFGGIFGHTLVNLRMTVPADQFEGRVPGVDAAIAAW